jgi:hypothetical protein
MLREYFTLHCNLSDIFKIFDSHHVSHANPDDRTSSSKIVGSRPQTLLGLIDASTIVGRVIQIAPSPTQQTQYPTITTYWVPSVLHGTMTTWMPVTYTQTFQTTAPVGPLGSGWTCSECGTGNLADGSDQVEQQGLGEGRRVGLVMAVWIMMSVGWMVLGRQL